MITFDWGLTGARVSEADVVVVVDVLSFTTAVTVACERGALVYPFRWQDERAADFAAAQDAVLALGRGEARRRGRGEPSLSPHDLRDGAAYERLVLPSPNGSTIALALAESGRAVVAGCLRNASAVADHVADQLADHTGSIAVIAAGEKWPDDSLRPAVEDALGAGAILAGLRDRIGDGPLTSEARYAAAAFTATADVAAAVRDSVSGRELIEQHFAGDVDVAVELDRSSIMPTLIDGAFRSG